MTENWNTYVVGECNKFAHAVLTAVLKESPGEMNPVIIWGASASGKTRMLTEFATAARAAGKTVCKKTYKEINGEILKDIHNDNSKAYREKYRTYDYVIIDDLQYLNGKASTQEEFTHFFDKLITADIQVILALSLPVTSLSVIEEWRRCHWPWAVVAELELPDVETKKKALLAIVAKMNSKMPADVLEYIAVRSKDYRIIEGIMNSLQARRKLLHEEITVETAEKVLSEKQII